VLHALLAEGGSSRSRSKRLIEQVNLVASTKSNAVELTNPVIHRSSSSRTLIGCLRF
jgi:hypothetical protein